MHALCVQVKWKMISTITSIDTLICVAQVLLKIYSVFDEILFYREDVKMKRSKWIFFIWIAIGLMIQFSLPSSVGSKIGIAPRKSDRGDRWRIGYYQGGEYIDYQKTLLATINGLMEQRS